MPRTAIPTATLACVILLATGLSARADRYWILFRDGTMVLADRFADGDAWSDNAQLPHRMLFAADNPVCTLRDNQLELPPPVASYVLLANGDVLPGRVLKYVPASVDDNRPAHLILAPRCCIESADAEGLTVRADRVLRIVSGGPAPVHSAPGTLVFADGKTLVAKSVRFSEDGVKALSDDGVVNARFDELVEVHVPKVDRMAAVLDDGFALPLHDEGLVGRLETVDGAVITYRRAAARADVEEPDPRTPQRNRPPARRLAYLRPSWSLDTVRVPVDAVFQQTFRPTYELPLSLMRATVLREDRGIHYWPWRRNRNVRGERLGCGPLVVGLGLGTHSQSQIAFDLPVGAEQFTALVGLDNSVGEQGCVTLRVFHDRSQRKPAFEREYLRGSDLPVPIGPLDLSGAKQLILMTNFAHNGRPEDADPLDVGDHVNWLLPTVTVRADPVARSVRLRQFVPGWNRWTLNDVDAERLIASVRWDRRLGRWEAVIDTNHPEGFTLERAVPEVSDATDLLELVVSPDEEVERWRIELSADGEVLEPITSEPVMGPSVRARHRRFPEQIDLGMVFRWDLQAFRGRAVKLALKAVPERGAGGLQWRSCILTAAAANPPPGRSRLGRAVPEKQGDLHSRPR
ncbi:MAG: NPCBM/NEW2 domain-containing protein [Candidatus Nealsonbacteria bacterium]|nr:NPCBM/NEW2 domain-containing protein [Candidatus Nealsonbacteria bacterium]